MRSFTKLLTLALLCGAAILIPRWAASQEAARTVNQEAQEFFSQIDQVQVDERSNRPVFVKGRLAEQLDLRDEGQVMGYMETVSRFFGLEPSRDGFSTRKSFSDQLGMNHARLQHLHRGVPVFGSEIFLHSDAAGALQLLNGQLVDHLDIDVTPSLAADQALQTALQHLGPASYRWDNPTEEAIIKEVFDQSHTWRPQPALVIAPVNGDFAGSDYRLAWKMLIPVDAPKPANWVYFVDAKSGEVINYFNKMHPVTGTGASLYSGTVSFETNFNGSTYEMFDTGRNIKTYDAKSNTNAADDVLGTDSDNNWPLNALVDAHWGGTKFHEYYQTVHGRNSFNGAGAQMTSRVHYNLNWVNASWNGVEVRYGDGDGVNSSALVTLDVAGHEWTHAVTDYESDLVYQGESGALNESWSDIFGETIEKYFKDDGLWLIGEECWTPGTSGDALRSMANPNSEGQPDTYGGTFWVNPAQWWNDNGGVHTNSGVSNFAYYLLVNGGSGTNDIGNSYSVSSIGIADARAIFYLAQTTYLTSSSTFAAARTATENAASALFGSSSNQKTQVSNAWYAVGVGSAPGGGGSCNNIAQGKTATASSTYSSSRSPAKAVDGSTSSYWRSASGGTQWLQVDLGSSPVSYGSWEIVWNSSRHATSYSIQVSTSSSFSSPITVFSTTSGNGGTDTGTMTGSPRTERYIRIHMTVPNSSHYRVAEFRVCSSGGSLTGIGSDQGIGGNQSTAAAVIPDEITLRNNYPNPFNPSTNISFGLPSESHVSLKVYNLLGQEVATLVDERRIAGFHTVTFQPTDLSSGVYFYVLQAGETRLTRRLVFMK